MSQSTVIECVLGCVKDPVFGYAAQLAKVVEGRGIDPAKIRDDFRFHRLRLPLNTLTTTQPNVAVRARRWEAQGRTANLRDGTMFVDVLAEYFDADEETLALNVDIGADAMALTLDGLRDYSDSVKGPIIDFIDPIVIDTGTFDNQPASSGFIATIQLRERTALPTP
jgi:hypothetical protein